MARYTKLGTGLFDWTPYQALSFPARALWLGLYASLESKRCLPGLFHGGISVMAEAAAMSAVDAATSLRELEDRKLVVHDRRTRLTVFQELPDRGERPCNGRALLMFWRRWNDLPDCRVRYLWIDVLRWLCEPMTVDHSKVWASTFGTVESSAVGATNVLDTHTDTHWHTHTDTHKVIHRLSTDADSSAGGRELPLGQLELCCPIEPTFDDKLSTGYPQQSTGEPDTVSQTLNSLWVSYTHGLHGMGIRSLLPECGDEGHSGRDGPPAVTQGAPAPMRRATGLPASLTVKALCDALQETSNGRVALGIIDHRTGPRLWETVAVLESLKMGLKEVRLAGEYLAAGGLGYRHDLDARWLGGPGNLCGVISQAKKWEEAGRPDLGKKPNSGGSLLVQAADGLREINRWAETGYETEQRSALVSDRTLRALRQVGGVHELRTTPDAQKWRQQFAAAYVAEGEQNQ